MVTGFNNTPSTLDELISQAHEWDGPLKEVVPYFAKDNMGNDIMPPRIVSVALIYEDEFLSQSLWNRTSRGWVLCIDGGGDCSINGGSSLTGREA